MPMVIADDMAGDVTMIETTVVVVRRVLNSIGKSLVLMAAGMGAGSGAGCSVRLARCRAGELAWDLRTYSKPTVKKVVLEKFIDDTYDLELIVYLDVLTMWLPMPMPSCRSGIMCCIGLM